MRTRRRNVEDELDDEEVRKPAKSNKRRRLMLFDDECSTSVVAYETNKNEFDDEEDDLDDDELDGNDSFISENDEVEAAETGDDEDQSEEEVDDDEEDEAWCEHEDERPAKRTKQALCSPSNEKVADDADADATTTQLKRTRGRPRIHPVSPVDINRSKKKSAADTKPPGHHTYPINDFSLTISKTGGDVELCVLEKVYEFLVKYALKGGVSTEVGNRAHNLHLQAMFQMRYPKDKAHVKEAVALLKQDLIKPLTGYKILLKPFATSQNFSAMLGYITKDQGKFYCFALYCNFFE